MDFTQGLWATILPGNFANDLVRYAKNVLGSSLDLAFTPGRDARSPSCQIFLVPQDIHVLQHDRGASHPVPFFATPDIPTPEVQIQQAVMAPPPWAAFIPFDDDFAGRSEKPRDTTAGGNQRTPSEK